MSMDHLISLIAQADPRVAEKLVPNGECLDYAGYKNQDGYGKVNRNGIAISAHRYIWIRLFGEIDKGLVVCHKCDNRACCNPDHLFVGTQADNVRDMNEKGRGNHPGPINPARKYGSENNKAKLTEEDVRWIRNHHRPGRLSPTGCPQLAKKFGVNRNTVLAIIAGQTWKGVA